MELLRNIGRFFKSFRKSQETVTETSWIDEEAMKNAKRAGAEEWKAPTPDHEMKIACLKRWNALLDEPVPEDRLLSLEPSGLTEQELNNWYWGIRGDATREFLKICNQSHAKFEVEEKRSAAGLDDIWKIMDKDNAECAREVLKYIS